jgi:hypothetical protein
MIRTLLVILLCLSLVSPAPVPETHSIYWTRIDVSRGARVQECTYDTAPEQDRKIVYVYDSIGYIYGDVRAWSCSGDTLAVARELIARAGAMQSEAAAYRLAHPIGGAP